VRITGHSDHYDRDQWVAMLNSLTGVWFKEFTAGGFVIGWPEAVAAMVKKDWPEITKEVFKTTGPVIGTTKPETVLNESRPTEPKTRAEELAGMKFFTLVGVAKKLGLVTEGKKGPAIIAEILDRESKPVTEPTLAEY
jgi:hypothetical protein